MPLSFFSFSQIWPLFPAVLLLSGAVISFHAGRTGLSLWLLFLGSLGLGIFMAGLDPFLGLWDEQYHALVAKNMMDDPFRPMLYKEPLYEYNFQYWTGNQVWLHKQPLFLWQIALSLRCFGINEMAVRVPDILMHALAALMIFRIGKISVDGRTGFYGALFFSVAWYPLELIAGHFETDHNDLAFLFYVTASFWTWFEYLHSGRSRWWILTGVFAGGAVLVKWLTGLLIFAVWGLAVVAGTPRREINLKKFIPGIGSFAVAVAVFLPWQIYILQAFPKEASYEYQLNTRHFFEAVEGHSGDAWFHVNALKTLYGAGDLIPWLLLAGVLMLIRKTRDPLFRLGFALSIVLVYGFFSLSATKMVSFCLIVAPFAFLGLAALTGSFTAMIERWNLKALTRNLIQSALVLLVAFFLLNLPKIQHYHTLWKPEDNFNRPAELAEKRAILYTREVLGEGRYVVFNVNITRNGHIAMMFYTPYLAYDFVPTAGQILHARTQGYRVAVFDDPLLPEYIRDDPEIVILYVHNLHDVNLN